MNLAEQTAADWTRLRKEKEWQDSEPPLFPDWQPVAVKIEHEDYTEAADLERALAAFPATAGWVERQSRTLYFESEGLPPGEGEFDAIVAAELAGESAGLSVRVLAGGWRLTRITETAGAADHLCCDRDYAGVDRLPASGQSFGRKIRYRVYQRHDPDHGWRPIAARLLGFSGETS